MSLTSLFCVLLASGSSAFQGQVRLSSLPTGGLYYGSQKVIRNRSDQRLSPPMLASVDSSDGHSDDNIVKIKWGLTKEFFSIGFPAFIQLAAEPLAALVDTVRTLLALVLPFFYCTSHSNQLSTGIPRASWTRCFGRGRCRRISSVCSIKALQ